MLKACWDCIAGDRTYVEEAYGRQTNGVPLSVQTPPWPQTQLEKENMFLLPKQLNENDAIVINGTFTSNPKILTIAFITGNNTPDYQNVACQLDLYFPANNGNDKISIKSIVNGVDKNVKDSEKTTDFIVNNEFNIKFVVREGSMDLHIDSSYVDSPLLIHNRNDIRFLSVSGDYEKVKNLDFEFA